LEAEKNQKEALETAQKKNIKEMEKQIQIQKNEYIKSQHEMIKKLEQEK